MHINCYQKLKLMDYKDNKDNIRSWTAKNQLTHHLVTMQRNTIEGPRERRRRMHRGTVAVGSRNFCSGRRFGSLPPVGNPLWLTMWSCKGIPSTGKQARRRKSGMRRRRFWSMYTTWNIKIFLFIFFLHYLMDQYLRWYKKIPR